MKIIRSNTIDAMAGKIFQPTAFYRESFSSDFHMVVHVHNYYEIMYCQEGSFLFEIYTDDGKTLLRTHKIEAKQFVIINSGLSHRISISDKARIMNVEFSIVPAQDYDPNSVNRYVFLNLYELFRMEGLKQWITAPHHFIIGADGHNLEHYFSRYISTLGENICAGSLTDQLKQSARLLQFLIELNTCLSDGRQQSGIIHLKKALTFINQNFMKPITVDDVAAAVGIHKAYLQRLFKEHLRTTIIKELNGLRIKKCKELLLNTNMTLDEICSNAGFSNRQNFIYEFKSSTGLSPADFRKMRNNHDVRFAPDVYNSINFWTDKNCP